MNDSHRGNIDNQTQMESPEKDDKKPDTLPERDISTEKLDTGQFSPELRKQLAEVSETPQSNERKLVLFFPTDSDPLVIEMTGTITLGRLDLRANIHPTIDLSVYHGAQLGVSRFHAEITLVNGAFHIKDMGSTNGTRVNNKPVAAYRLVPFKSGDTLRLGYLNILVG